MIKPTCLIPAVLLLGLSLPATARELPIGTYGATITLDESWQRQELSPDVRPDQFMNDRAE